MEMMESRTSEWWHDIVIKPKAVLLGTVVVLIFKHMPYADCLLSARLELYANVKVSTTEVAAELGINRHALG